MPPLDLLWLFVVLSSLQPLVQQRLLVIRRAQALRALERRNGSRAITLIHRREYPAASILAAVSQQDPTASRTRP